MKKFDRLLIQLKNYNDSALDLADFGLTQNQLEILVDALNENPAIKILILKHNSLGDNCVPLLTKLTNIESLDVSYNNFTKKGIATLILETQAKNTLHVCADHNNTKTLFLYEQQEQVPASSCLQASDDTLNSYAGDLFRQILLKLSEMPLPNAGKQLVTRKLIAMLTSNEKEFDFEREEGPALKAEIGKPTV